MAEHSATSGARKIDMPPKQGTPIHSKEGPKPFSGFYWVFTGYGWFTQNLGYPGVQPNSGLCVTVCEVDANGIPFVGNAFMYIGNVAPGMIACWSMVALIMIVTSIIGLPLR
jgi:hypothetical protein